MNDIDRVVQRFRGAGLKITPQRLSIFNLLRENRKHPSAEDVFHQVLKIHPSISFTTVYKTLQTLKDLGEINELTIDPERAHYDPDMSRHYHTVCRGCREISDVFPDQQTFPPIDPDLKTFQVHSVQVHYVGQCEGCQ